MRTLYEKPSNRQRENSFFETFVSLALDIPLGHWQKDEAPDYLLTTLTTKIGLEITSLISRQMAGIRNSQDQAFALARKMAAEENMPIMEVQAKFREERAPIKPTEAAVELVDIVKKKLPELDDTKGYLLSEFDGKYFSTIIVNLGTRNGNKWLDSHRWHRAHINWVKQDPIVELQQALDEKATRLPQYLQKCNECWLLVGVDEWTAPEAIYFSSQGFEHVFSCNFSRAYFLRNIEGKLTRLKLE